MAAVMQIYRVGLTNSREGILERTRFVEVSAESPSEAMRKAWETPAGLAFMLVHCALYPAQVCLGAGCLVGFEALVPGQETGVTLQES